MSEVKKTTKTASKVTKKKEKKLDVKFITSIALAVNGIDDEVSHLQLTIVQECKTKKFQAFMDVVDVSKIKLAEE